MRIQRGIGQFKRAQPVQRRGGHGRSITQRRDKARDFCSIGGDVACHEKIQQRGVMEALRIGKLNIRPVLVLGADHARCAQHFNALVIAIGGAARVVMMACLPLGVRNITFTLS